MLRWVEWGPRPVGHTHVRKRVQRPDRSKHLSGLGTHAARYGHQLLVGYPLAELLMACADLAHFSRHDRHSSQI